jgi:energy-coupling factor transporter transmembrane protein EcfT
MLLVAFLFLLGWLTTHYVGAVIWHRLLQFNLHQDEDYIPVGLSNILGLAAIALALSITHFISSISWVMMFVLFILAINDRQNTKRYFEQSWQQIKPHLIWIIPATFFSWITILLRPGVGDIADYHLQDILWAEHYPLLKGLGNFNRPLANNNWWFNLQAFFGLNQFTSASV